MPKLPTSDMNGFREQLLNPNLAFESTKQEGQIMKIQKNFVISIVSDSTGCGHIRNIFPMTYLNSQFGKSGKFNLILTPVPIMQPELLARCRSIYFQRMMNPKQIPMIQNYKNMQQKLRFKMVYDIDDFIWEGPDKGEEIPKYNFGRTNITDEVRAANIEIMNMMDVVCVSTEFLKKYIKQNLKCSADVVVVPNAVPQYFWGPGKKRPITKRIERPRVLYTGSPTHYNNGERLKGDWENAWCEWVIKNVRENKIQFTVMGGLPFFFEGIKDRIKIIPWKNSYQYHLPVKQSRADFGIAPLVPNYFNYGKSDIKHIEYCSLGIASIGTVFDNGFPSPYDDNFLKVKNTVSVKELDELFDEYCEPDRYNEIVKKQYEMMDADGRWLESKKYVELLLSIF